MNGLRIAFATLLLATTLGSLPRGSSAAPMADRRDAPAAVPWRLASEVQPGTVFRTASDGLFLRVKEYDGVVAFPGVGRLTVLVVDLRRHQLLFIDQKTWCQPAVSATIDPVFSGGYTAQELYEAMGIEYDPEKLWP